MLASAAIPADFHVDRRSGIRAGVVVGVEGNYEACSQPSSPKLDPSSTLGQRQTPFRRGTCSAAPDPNFEISIILR